MTKSKTVLISLVTPSTGRVVLTILTSVVPPTQVGDQGGVVLLRTLFEVSGPIHALAVWEGGQVGIPVDAHLLVVTPHAQA